MSPEIRPELSKAISTRLGITTEKGETRLAESLIRLTAEQVEKYQIHGITVVQLHITFATTEFLIDVDSLKRMARPQHVWFKAFSPNDLFLAISSGKQQASKKATELSNDRNLEGLSVMLNWKVSPNSQIPYLAELDPLYSD